MTTTDSRQLGEVSPHWLEIFVISIVKKTVKKAVDKMRLAGTP